MTILRSLFLTSTMLMAGFNAYAQSATYETVAAYGESYERVIRWPDGAIKVYDETRILDRHPKVLETLNQNLNKSFLVLTPRAEEADIKIEYVKVLPVPYQTSCATASPQINHMTGVIQKSIIRVREEPNPCMTRDNGAILLMHEMGHALGFSAHAKENDVMSNHDPSYDKDVIPMNTLQRFLRGAYSLPPGAPIPKNTPMPEPQGVLAWSNGEGGTAVAKLELSPERYQVAKVTPLKDPVLERRNLTPVNSSSRVQHQATMSTPQLKYKRVEKTLPNGLTTWEFVLDDATPTQNTQRPVAQEKALAATAKRGMETISPKKDPKGGIEWIGPQLP